MQKHAKENVNRMSSMETRPNHTIALVHTDMNMMYPNDANTPSTGPHIRMANQEFLTSPARVQHAH